MRSELETELEVELGVSTGATNLSGRSYSAPVARVEQKFFLTPDRLPVALALLCRVCRRDSMFPVD